MIEGSAPTPARRLLWPAARVSLNLLLVAAAVGLVAWLAGLLRLVVVPVLVSVLIAALLVPLANLLRRVLPSALATLLAMLLAAGVVGALLALVLPAIVDQADDVGRSVEEGLGQALTWLTEGPLDLERAQVERAVDDALAAARENSDAIRVGVVQGAAVVAEFVAGGLLTVVLVFFFVHDGRRIFDWLVGLFPARRRDDVRTIGERSWAAASGYVRGVAVIAVVDAVLIGIALLIIGVPLVIPLSALVFLGAFVPLIGAVVAGTVAALVALVSEGALAALLVVGVITLIQQVEGDLLYPVVVGQAISLHPVAILLALTAGTIVAGLAGALLAVPVAAAGWIAVDQLRDRGPPATAGR